MLRLRREGWWILGCPVLVAATDGRGPPPAVPPPTPDDEAAACADGAWCAPIPLGALSVLDSGDTRGAEAVVDRYGCDPSIDESGGEVVYELLLDAPTWVRARVDGERGSDPDLHLLTGVGPGGCRMRADDRLSVVLPAGQYWLVVDAWESRVGPFELSVDQARLPAGRCAMAPRSQLMFWPHCADGMDCVASDSDIRARTPASGPVAREAHLRTEADAAWPTSGREALEEHFQSSARWSGYAMHRKEPWAPSPTGATWAMPSFGKPLPPVAETWYVNMFWREKPAPGERMILWSPTTGRTVVGAAGYETGPRDPAALGGASEEVHHALGTHHLEELVMGFAADQSLPYGPIACP